MLTVQVPPLTDWKSSPVAPCVTTFIDPSVKLLVNNTVAVCVPLRVPIFSVGAVEGPVVTKSVPELEVALNCESPAIAAPIVWPPNVIPEVV